MHPFEKEPPGPPPGVAPSLSVVLKSGWRFVPGRRSLVPADGKPVSLRGVLPAGAKVVPTAPSLAKAAPGTLSDDEEFLARSLQVVLPAGADPAEKAAALRGLDGVERVSAAPRVGLP
jgi:hypothetical protein